MAKKAILFVCLHFYISTFFSGKTGERPRGSSKAEEKKELKELTLSSSSLGQTSCKLSSLCMHFCALL